MSILCCSTYSPAGENGCRRAENRESRPCQHAFPRVRIESMSKGKLMRVQPGNMKDESRFAAAARAADASGIGGSALHPGGGLALGLLATFTIPGGRDTRHGRKKRGYEKTEDERLRTQQKTTCCRANIHRSYAPGSTGSWSRLLLSHVD